MDRLLVILTLSICFGSVAAESVCYGTTSNGHLENGVELPSEGDNFVTYSTVARLAGRTYVHSTVHDIVVSSYARLYQELPTKVYKYAETGFESGGRFRPHKTHRNGLSVDFMTPVMDAKGKSVHLPTNLFNKLGYKIEFDSKGQYDSLVIDYEAMAAHIVALHKEALAYNVDLWRVIFDPELQPNLLKTQYGQYLKEHIQFSKKRSWVRHDEHYHVDFKVPCSALI
ncbi:penicillin-insensitive murein endopeptidase [Agarivorans sp. Alg241-V36]|uniref:penicillin-insensitive murein endopeptidase n=1 Tax=Agarivorans sp. Alg241-V36 TaxID=2305992 RepID=UPI0013D4B16B|nr:penicillin-insensitive murein endopeptidase [Agarivorans sp. Alg241-V36]